MESSPVHDEQGPDCSKCGGPQYRRGRDWTCKPCAKEYGRAYYRANKEKLSAANRLNYQQNRDAYKRRAKAWKSRNPDKVKASGAAYYQQNREKILAKQIARYLANPSAFFRASSKWAKANPEARRAMLARRRARLAEAICSHGDGCVDAAFLVVVYAADCTYCGAPADHADHFHPINRGGLHCRKNIVPACAHCNISKLDRDPIEWLESRIA